MSELTRRDFLLQSILLAAGSVVISCNNDPDEENNKDSPGALSGNKPSQQVIIVGAGISGLVAA